MWLPHPAGTDSGEGTDRELLPPPHPLELGTSRRDGGKIFKDMRKPALKPRSLGHEASPHHLPARRDPAELRWLPVRAGTLPASRALWGAGAGGDTGPPGDGGQGALGAADQQCGLGAAGSGSRGRAQPHLVLRFLLRAPRFAGLFVSCGDNRGAQHPCPLHHRPVQPTQPSLSIQPGQGAGRKLRSLQSGFWGLAPSKSLP